jgi:hypothetical protein
MHTLCRLDPNAAFPALEALSMPTPAPVPQAHRQLVAAVGVSP